MQVSWLDPRGNSISIDWNNVNLGQGKGSAAPSHFDRPFRKTTDSSNTYKNNYKNWPHPTRNATQKPKHRVCPVRTLSLLNITNASLATSTMATYKHCMILLLGLLALATNVFATRVRYVASFDNGIGKDPGSTGRNGQIADAHAKPLLDGISQWSSGKYKASQHAQTKIITVVPAQRVKTKGEASQAVQDMVHLVCTKLKECGKTD
ncbi:hypothetical protein TOPH_06262 [Tolypocladium ophioglossoides CBS 100239]|uniref:Uncharacterized protein n=1 Tax=Tolypocladium ophioglossoides (strain CBS 100239) TaxID=1163406 RepID=A0A0L0N5H5_TOLOC|nr:hypothetical protein TOPH_06262 [Tolypocladium ophioglossoides CBS 100239]